MTRLIFGCGYLGQRVGQRWIERGERPVAVTRSAQRAEELARLGFQPLVADVTRPETLHHLPAAETVVYAVAYGRANSLSRTEVQVAGLRAALDALRQPPRRLVYISSTSVYGDCHGGWVDEDTPCQPDREQGRVALAAEETLRSHPVGSSAVVLRLAGMYGRGRIPSLGDLAAGRPLAVAADAVVNLIHVDDAAAIVLAAAEQADPPTLLLVSDGHPVLRREFYRCLSQWLRLPPPTFLEPEPAELASRRGFGSKRVRNARMLQALGAPLRYPTYREGLAAVAQARS